MLNPLNTIDLYTRLHINVPVHWRPVYRSNSYSYCSSDYELLSVEGYKSIKVQKLLERVKENSVTLTFADSSWNLASASNKLWKLLAINPTRLRKIVTRHTNVKQKSSMIIFIFSLYSQQD